MRDTEVLDVVIKTLHKVGKVPSSMYVGAETRLVEDLGIDSLDLVAAFLAIQDEFDVLIDDDAVTELRRVQDLVDHVTSQRAELAA